MSIHKSLVTAGRLRRHRNVFTRAERLEILKKEGRWQEGQSVFGLSKVRSIMMKTKKKASAEEPEAVPEAGATAQEAGGKPLAGADKASTAPAGSGAKPAAPPKREEKKR